MLSPARGAPGSSPLRASLRLTISASRLRLCPSSVFSVTKIQADGIYLRAASASSVSELRLGSVTKSDASSQFVCLSTKNQRLPQVSPRPPAKTWQNNRHHALRPGLPAALPDHGHCRRVHGAPLHFRQSRIKSSNLTSLITGLKHKLMTQKSPPFFQFIRLKAC